MAIVMTLCPDCKCMTSQREDPMASGPRHERGCRCQWCEDKRQAQQDRTDRGLAARSR